MTSPPQSPQAAPQWRARAHSIADIEASLSRIWSDAAQEAEEAGLSQGERADARGDPHLAAHMDEARDVRVRTRTSVLTLVVVATRPETVDRAMDAVRLLASRHPSRAILLAPGDPDGPPTVDAQIYAACHLSDAGNSETCTEQILVRIGGELNQHLAATVAPLLIHDLPCVLWWPDDPPIGRPHFRQLREQSDRLLVDSGSFGGDGRKRLAALASIVAEDRTVVHDIGWMRLTLWRELFAGLFDHPLLTPELARVHSLRIDVARPSDTFRITKAATFAGWLSTMLDWDLDRPMEQRRGSDSLVGAFRQGRHEVKVEFRPVNTRGERTLRFPGHMVRVEMELGSARSPVRVRVTRHEDHLLATADWKGAQVTRRAGRLEPFGEAPYLAEALEATGADLIFERSLARATRLVGG
ncbi:glucose-6-phosphate dehydrogenase assembly protein OpcA [soil metagenome]